MGDIGRRYGDLAPAWRSGRAPKDRFGYVSAVWFGILGHLAVRAADGADVPIPGPARRQVLAALLCRPGAVVTAATLVEDLWGSAPPRSAVNSLRSHVVRLRAALAQAGDENVLVTVGDGYRLDIAAGDVDAGRFEALVEEAGRTSGSDAAIARYDEALRLWRDEAYVEFGDAPFAVLERIRLTELRALARERRTDLALAAGTGAELVADLEQRVRCEPYRERGWEQLALALYRAGRQADALGACRRARQVLLDDLGVDPGPGLRTLEQRVLQQDPRLLAATVPEPAVAQRVVDRCPYLGLASYEEQDATLFVGRERLTSTVAGRLADQSVVVVTGASGVGKSSLVRAGLVPALRAGALPGSSAWRIDVRTPGSAVLVEDERRPDLLVLDQAEELFTGMDPAARDDLVHRLARYLDEEQGRLLVVLRSDFYGRLAELASLAPYAEKTAVLVGPMRADELRRALVEPAAWAGLQLEDELVETIMDDVAGQPEPLPLLSEAMVRTWARRDGDLLTLAGYEQAGELAGALNAAAEECYAGLDAPAQRAARQLLVRMARRSDTGWVRRSVTVTDSLDDAERQALSALIAARLVVADERRVEISHEALLAHWPRLRDWLAERSLAADLLEHLEQATFEWHTAGRQETDLYRGPRLSAATDWRSEHPEDLSPAEHEFLDASARHADAELRAARAQTRRLRRVALALVAVVALAVAGGVVALVERGIAQAQSRRAKHSALVADARRVAALAANAPDTATASQLALAAYRLQDTRETRSALLAAVERDGGALWRMQFPERVFDVTATASGSRVALRGGRGIVVIDPAARRQVADFATPGGQLAGLSADGREVVSFETNDSPAQEAGRLVVQAVPSGRLVRVLAYNGDGNTGVARSYGGRWFALITTKHVAGGVVVQVYDSTHWAAPPHTFLAAGRPVLMEAGVTSLAVEHADGSIEVRGLPSLRRLGGLPPTAQKPDLNSPPPALAVSPDGSLLARADPADPSKVTLYDLRRPGSAGIRLPAIPGGGAGTMHFSADGAELAIGSVGGPLGVYRSSDGVLRDAFAGNSGQLFQLAWAGESAPTALYSVGLDGELISWDVSNQPRLLQESGPDYNGFRAAVQTNIAVRGSRQVVAFQAAQDPQGTPRWRLAMSLRTGKISRWPTGAFDPTTCCTAMSVSSDGRLALSEVPYSSGIARNDLYDLRTDKVLWHTSSPASGNAVISPDGKRAFISVSRTRIGVYTLPSGRRLCSFDVNFPGADPAIQSWPWAVDPAGRLLVAGAVNNGADNRLGLVNPASGKLLADVRIGDIGQVMSQAWSNGGGVLAVGTFTGTLFLLDANTLAIRAQLNAAEPTAIRSISFSPDDQTLVITGESGELDFLTVPALDRELHITIGDGRVYAWYNRAGQLLGVAPDLRRPGADMYRSYVLRSDPVSVTAEACRLAGRGMTHAQWQRYVGDQPYRNICP